ncbi:MAG: hypothetical protein KAR83_10360 [Thermodesulfovibrionales bacterium]|nr:hypothetical protein [Thermodesulfovibrionales bacterium]
MRKILNILGSTWTTTLLLGLMAFAYALAGVWGEPLSLWSSFMAGNPLGLLLYFLLVANLLVSDPLAIRAMRDRGRPTGTSPDKARAMDDHVLVRKKDFDPYGPSEWMRSKGLSPRETEGGLIARKGAYSILPGLMLRAGLLLLLIALPLSSTHHQSARAMLSPGEDATVLGHEIKLMGLDAPLTEEYLQVGKEGEGSFLELHGLGATLEVDGKSMALREGAPAAAGSLMMRLSYLGYRLPVKRGQDTVLMYLDALPPGKVCEPVAGVLVRLLPERTVKKGLLSGRLYNLKAPYFSIVTEEGEHALRAGEASKDGSVELGKSSLYIELEVRRDAALTFVKAGLVLLVLGLALMPLRLFWYEMIIVAVQDGDSVVLGSTDEFFKAWGIERFREWTDELITSEDSSNEKP